MKESLFILVQYLLPQQLLSRLVGVIARCRAGWVRKPFISWFVRRYGVDMEEARETDPHAYRDFIDFFTRELRPGARPLPQDESAVVCPADGAISQLGTIDEGLLLQAKGRQFSAEQLLGGDAERAQMYSTGNFMTVYLAPRDYHRVHMPLGGTLRQMRYVPGKLFSVNHTTAEHVPDLFARNERVICHFDTDRGPMTMVLVGAMIVAGVETVWAGEVCPGNRQAFTRDYSEHSPLIQIPRGEEMGRFKLGSTVILLFPPDAVEFHPDLAPGDRVRMGQAITS